MSLEQIKDELLKIWPSGADCGHIHAATAFRLLDELIKEEKEPPKRYFNDGKKP